MVDDFAPQGSVLKATVQLELLPELHPHVLAVALRKLQAPAPATAAADETAPQAGDFVETPGGDIGIVEWAAYPVPEPASDEAEPATEARPTEAADEALAHNAVAVEPVPASKGNGALPDKRLWTVEAAQPIVYAYLQKHPYATAKAIETETGIPDSTVCKTQAWKRRRFKRPKGKRSGQARRGAVSLTEKVMAMAGMVAGPDVDIESLIRRCEAEPDFRQTLEDAYEASNGDGAAQEQGCRPVA